MGVPGNFAERAPAGLADTELFAVDAYRTTFDARVVEVDREGGRIRLDRTAFYPTGGGQPHDTGTLTGPDGAVRVTGVRRESGLIWHAVAADPGALPEVGTEVGGEVDWSRRFQLMRTHTALHILCGVIWADHGIPVTGGNMEPLKGRLDFPFPAMSADLGAQVEQPDQRRDRAGARDRRRLPAARRRGRRSRTDPHRRPPDPGRHRPTPDHRHRRARPAGRRRHPRAVDRRGGSGEGHRDGEQGQGQQADPARDI